MINLTTLLCDLASYGDSLRYSPDTRNATKGTTSHQGPVVVWNCTSRCNQNCAHCYMEATNMEATDSAPKARQEELDTDEGKMLIDDLANLKVPVILLSGGEPLIRKDFWDLAQYAIKNHIRVTVSTNGTLITPSVARDMKKLGVSYVGISLDGIGETHDRFRNSPGAFDRTLEAIRYCREADQKVGLRFTLTQGNVQDLEEVLHLIKEEGIPRICFYHLVHAGRGKDLQNELLPPEKTREVINILINNTEALAKKGFKKEILTVDNHADGVYLYLSLLQRDPERAQKVLEMLKYNGGNRSGIAITAIDPLGGIHPDQFSQNQILGNIREIPFSVIWNEGTPLLEKLRTRTEHLKGRCSDCQWLSICNGNLRARAYAFCGDFWEEDPGCYLTNQEIGLNI